MVCKATFTNKLVSKWYKYPLMLALLVLFGTEKAAAYCTTGLGGATYAWINSVSITGTTLNNANTGLAPTYYTAYPPTGNTTATLLLGSTYTLNVAFDPGNAAIGSLWIDYNGNNVFEASEWLQITTNAINASINFTVPLTATPGTTGMRIRSRGTGNPNGSGDACSSFGSGETEDYTITIASPVPCAGTPNAGTATATPSTVCNGASAIISLSGQSIASGISYQWQWLNGAVWTDITGATSPAYSTPGLTVATTYRARLKCANLTPGVPDSAFSTPVTVNIYATSLPYQETFESITSNNQLPNCMTSTNLGTLTLTYTAPTGSWNQTNHTPGGSKYACYRWTSGSDAFITPAFNLQAGRTYEFSYWYITDGYAASWLGLQAYYGTSPTIAGLTNLIGSVTPTPITNTTYQRFVQTFTPTTTGTYYVGIVCNRNSIPFYLSIDDIGLIELPPCSGQPTGGAAIASNTAPCPGATVDLSLSTAATNASGLVYQWEQNTGSGWGPIVGATNPTSRYCTSGPVTVVTNFRAKLKCTNGVPDSAYSAQVTVSPVVTALPYLETFESITANNQLPNCLGATNLNSNVYTYTTPPGFNNQINHTPGGSKFASFYYYPTQSDGIFTPMINMQAGKSYLFTFWYIGTSNANTWTSIDAYYGNAQNLTAMTNYIGSAAPTNNTTYEQFSQVFTPTTSGSYSVGIVAAHNSGTFSYYLTIDDIGLNELTPCTGRPSAGTITPVTPCPNAMFQLTRTGGTSATSVGNLTFLWQDSTSGGWANSLGPTATSPTYRTSISTATTYRVIVTCTNTGLSDTSASYTVQLANFMTCYCGSAATSTADDDIGNVTLTAQPTGTVLLNNGTASPLTNNSTSNHLYTNFTTLPATTLYRDSSYKVSLTQINSGGFYTCTGYAFIDYDHSGTFDASELIMPTTTTSSTSSPANQISRVFTVPTSALNGPTVMRVLLAEGTGYSPDPCLSYTWGETEDYLVNIQYPPCTGPLNPGTAVASESRMCVGYNFNVWDTTHEYRRSQMAWNWQNSYDGGLSWSDVPGSANKDTLNNILFTGTVSYRLKMICTPSGDSTFSPAATVTIKAPYECYCYSQSNGGSTDVSDIGAVVIGTMVNSTGGPHIMNPVAIRRRTDYTDIPNIVMNADGTYHFSVYHTQRNATHEDARISVFIDYNNDLVYNVTSQPNSERVLSAVTSLSNFYLDTVLHIPNAVIPNVPTGLRIILNSDLNPLAPANLGCGPYVSGETEDYVVMFRRVPSGVGGVNSIDNLALYPNPTGGRFTISASAAKAMDHIDVNVTTIAGQTMLHKTYSGVGMKFIEDLDMSEAAKGIYFVEIKSADGSKAVRKLIVR